MSAPSPDSAATTPVVLFGGTFDPVHRAHISCARAVSRQLAGARVALLPNAVPPHRPQPGASAAQRLAMLELAVQGHPALYVDDRELQRTGPSWTIDTLEQLRREQPHRPLVLVVGADSFASLQHWHRWQDYPGLCHLAVLPRPGAKAPDSSVCSAFQPADAAALMRCPAGLRLMLDSPRLDVSATAVRQALAQKGHCPALADAVVAYIRRHGLYNIGTGHDAAGQPPDSQHQ